MNNKTGFNRLSRRAGQRKALLKNMMTSLFEYERITTTKAKALEVKRFAEKMVTKAKVDSVHNRREIAKTITKDEVVKKLFTVLGPRFAARAGGYTRILKLGYRFGDAAEMVLLEFVEKTQAPEAPAEDKKVKNKATPKESVETDKEVNAEAPVDKKPAAKTAKPKTAKSKVADSAETPVAKKTAKKKVKSESTEKTE